MEQTEMEHDAEILFFIGDGETWVDEPYNRVAINIQDREAFNKYSDPTDGTEEGQKMAEWMQDVIAAAMRLRDLKPGEPCCYSHMQIRFNFDFINI